MVSRARMCVCGVLFAASVAASALGSPESDPRWGQAVAHQAGGRYGPAAALFHEIVVDHPRAQRAALRAAICEQRGGSHAQALANYQAANRIEPFGYWAEVGLYYEALLHRQVGDPVAARTCIASLRERFPDSRWRARGVVLEAELDGVDTTEAQAELAGELEAVEALKQAIGDGDRRNDAARLQLLQNVMNRFGDTGTALAVLDTHGHILIRSGQLEAAIEKFQAVVDRVGDSAPQSRVVQTAQTRLAGLNHALGRKTEALEAFRYLADYATDEAIQSNAATQAAGLDFERLQVKAFRGDEVLAHEWESVRSMSDRVASLQGASSGDRVRAALLQVESYCWENRSEDAIDAAEVFLDTFDPVEFKQDTATVCFFAGEEMLKIARYEEALELFRRIVIAYDGQQEIWPNMDHLPRTYFRIWETLRTIDASDATVAAAGDTLLSTFPESSYAEHVRVVNEREVR